MTLSQIKNYIRAKISPWMTDIIWHRWATSRGQTNLTKWLPTRSDGWSCSYSSLQHPDLQCVTDMVRPLRPIGALPNISHFTRTADCFSLEVGLGWWPMSWIRRTVLSRILKKWFTLWLITAPLWHDHVMQIFIQITVKWTVITTFYQTCKTMMDSEFR